MTEIICYFDGSCVGNEQTDQTKRTMRAAYKIEAEKPVIFDVPGLPASNNVAEYRGLIGLLDDLQFRHLHGGGIMFMGVPVDSVIIQGDSQLVVNQMRGEWRVREPHLQQLQKDARSIMWGSLGHIQFEFRWVPRDANPAGRALEATR